MGKEKQFFREEGYHERTNGVINDRIKRLKEAREKFGLEAHEVLGLLIVQQGIKKRRRYDEGVEENVKH